MKISPLWFVLVIALAVWAYFGFPSPNTLAMWTSAQEECVRFAKDNRENCFLAFQAPKFAPWTPGLRTGESSLK